MKTVLFSLAAAAALLASAPTVLAADLEPPPEIRTETFDWSGLYVGGFGGLIFVETPYIPVGAGDPEFGGASGVAGILAGAQWQMDNIVFGVEGDWGWGFGETAQNILDETDYTINYVATIRARLGYAMEDTMIYLTGGAAYANATLDAYVLGIDDDASHWGWVVGGGMEHAFTENFTGRIEYLYASFGEETYDLLPAGTVEMDIEDMHMVRAAFAFKFGI